MVEKGSSYSLTVGMVYCFNLMMGAGLIALPKAFVQGGWALGLAGITVLAFISYITVTFIIEAQSVCIALERHESKKNKTAETDTNAAITNNSAKYIIPEDDNTNDNNKQTNAQDAPSIYIYEITRKTELGELCSFFLNTFGYVVFYIAFCLYLFGCSSIYAAAIGKSLASIVCQDQDSFHSGNDSLPCKTIPQLTLMQSYRLSLAVFAVLCCPFAFFTITKTKILQLSTMAFRCFALVSMVVLALIKVVKKENAAKSLVAVPSKLPDFISTAIYALMCHYSIPTVITPIRQKKNLGVATFLDFTLVLIFCICLTMTAVFAFDADEVQDVYTLTFKEPVALKYVLELFPVLTLGANYPLIAIFLRDNIKKLFLKKKEEQYSFFIRRIVFPLIAITPSLIISYCTYDVGMLVGYTGAYAGGIIQCVIPVLLVYTARRRAREAFGEYTNRYASPLSGVFWLVLVMVWWLVSLGFITYTKISSSK